MRCVLAAAFSVALCANAGAQSLASKVNAVADGEITFHYASREGVCGDGQTYIRSGHSYYGSFNGEQRRSPCDDGPVQVVMTKHDGKIERLDARVGRLRSRDAKDLGPISTREASQYLLSLAANESGGVASRAVFAAVLADSAVVWPELLKIARDSETRSKSTRDEAAMWVGRFAGAAASGRPNTLFDDDDRDDASDLKRHAVFVLSQLPNHSGVPDMLSVARTSHDAAVRSSALFWLSQSGDARALDLFESLLRKS